MSAAGGKPPFRTGDAILHKPSGETWVCAWADPATGYLSWLGWPPGEAKIADFELANAVSDEEHIRNLRNLKGSGRRDAQRALRLYGDPDEAAHLEAQIRAHMRKHMFVVFDLDGTLALTEHRAHFLNRPGRDKDWRGFYAACDRDEPCHPIIRTLLALDATGAEVEIWSGRSDEVRDKTTAWLAEHGLGHIPIRTRAAGDHRPDTVLKAEWLDEGRKPDLIFEDRATMVQMYRKRGIVVCQVAEGDF